MSRSASACDDARMSLPRFDHVGITVADLDAATAFFIDVGLEVEGRAIVEGDFIDTVLGIEGARSEIVMLRVPGEETRVEVSTFLHPASEPLSAAFVPTQLGLRNVCFEVTDLEATLACLAERGHGVLGGVGRFEDQWLMAYVRGPEGVVVSLTQRIG